MFPFKTETFFSLLCILAITTMGLFGLVGCHEVSGSPAQDDPGEVQVDDALVGEEAEEIDEEKAVEIPSGERRVRIGFDAHRALAGNIEPGDRVDLVFTTPFAERYKPNDEEGDRGMTMRLLQNVRILDVDVSPTGDGSVGVSLSLTPDEAEAVLSTQTGGRLQLMLRAEGDGEIIPTRHITLQSVLEDLDEVYRLRSERRDDGEQRDRAALEETTRLAERIPDGKRAHTIVVSPFRSDEWSPKLGDPVDLTATIDSEHAYDTVFGEISENPRMSLDVLEDVEVLAVDDQPGENPGGLLTLSLTPTEVEMLITLETMGQIRAWLRSEDERHNESPENWHLRKMFNELDLRTDHRESLFDQQDAHVVGKFHEEMRPLTLAPELLDEQSLLPQTGTRVDIVGTFYGVAPELLPVEGLVDTMTIILVQNADVLQQQGDTVTIAVTRSEAHLFELLPSSTKLNLMERNTGDLDFVPVMRRTFPEVMEEIFVLNRPRCCRLPDTAPPPPCPPDQVRNDDGDCERDIRIIR